MYVKDIMTKEIITVNEADTVEKCANLLITHDLSGLPVVDEKGYVKGIITEGDLKAILLDTNQKFKFPHF